MSPVTTPLLYSASPCFHDSCFLVETNLLTRFVTTKNIQNIKKLRINLIVGVSV